MLTLARQSTSGFFGPANIRKNVMTIRGALPIVIKVIPSANDIKRIIRAADRALMSATRHGETMQFKCAVDFTHLLRRNVMTQKHGPYEPYSARYAAWKAKLFGFRGPGFHYLAGDFYRNIAAFKEGGGWVAGISYKAMDTGGKSFYGGGKRKPIAMYMKVMEYGGWYRGAGIHPARPIFDPTTTEYAASGEWEKRGQEALNYLKQVWV